MILIESGMLDTINHLKIFFHGSLIGQHPWLEWVLASTVDLFTGPFTGQKTRYFWVYMVQGILVLAVVYCLRSDAAQRRSARGFIRFCFPKGILTHPSTLVDYQLNAANFFFANVFKIGWRLNATFIATALVGVLVWAFGPAPHLLHWTPFAILLFTLLATIGDDFGDYVFHLAAHRIPQLWAFHKIHHTAEVLTPLTAGRVHPVEMAVSEPIRSAGVALVQAPALYLFAGDVSLATLFGINVVTLIFAGLGNQLLHSHVWISWGPKLDRIFVSPAVHQIHHSNAPKHWHRNLGGLFSVWDWMFGTLYVPVPGEEIEFGLAAGEAQIHPDVFRAYLLPFWEVIPFRHTILAALRAKRPIATIPTRAIADGPSDAANHFVSGN